MKKKDKIKRLEKEIYTLLVYNTELKQVKENLLISNSESAIELNKLNVLIDKLNNELSTANSSIIEKDKYIQRLGDILEENELIDCDTCKYKDEPLTYYTCCYCNGEIYNNWQPK